MRGYVGLTDYDWYQQLRAEKPDEVNFWRPLSGRQFRAVAPGEPFFFKLKARWGGGIAGFGIYAGFVPMRVDTAWETFETKNGVQSRVEMWQRIGHYVEKNRGVSVTRQHEIGCIVLTTPVFFEPDDVVRAPKDWGRYTQQGAGYDLDVGEGRRMWHECLERSQGRGSDALEYNLSLGSGTVEFRERVARMRLGQGGFRAMVTRVYEGTCAISGDHTLPALEAAHIKAVEHGGAHEVGNGLLLRADIHRLFDAHLVTVTPDLEFLVSERLREEYQNGAAYYALEEQHALYLPRDEALRPRPEYLEAHADQFFAKAG